MEGKWIELFRTGTHTDMSGRTRKWTREDLDRIVERYDPKVQEAPAVIGHPKLDAPAYAWVEALRREGEFLLGQFRQVAPQFAEWVREGRYKKRSIALNLDGSLRHVGFLGGVPPAVPGLADVQFAGDPAEVVEFADRWTISILRRLRDFFVELVGLETAEKIIPNWELESMQATEIREEERRGRFPPGSGFAGSEGNSNPQGGDDMDMEEIKKRLEEQRQQLEQAFEAKLAAQEKALKDQFAAQQTGLTQENEQLKRQTRLREIQAKLSKLKADGKLPPALIEQGLAEFVAGLDGATTVEFAAGNKETPEAFLWRLLEGLPPLVQFADTATADKARTENAEKKQVVDAMAAGFGGQTE